MRLQNFLNSKNFLLFVLLWVFLLYIPALNAQFTNWDDDVHVYEHVSVYALDQEHLERMFTETVNKIYIPLTTLSFAVEKHFFGLNPFVYHLNNILLHLFNVVLVYALALRFRMTPIAAAVAALLFGIHPMRVESVAWVTERKDVLYAFFYLLALLAYQRYLDKGGKGIFALAAVVACGVLSMLAKPMALSLPLVLFLLDWFYKRKLSVRLVWEKLFLIVPVAWIAWFSYAQHARVPGEEGVIQAFLIWTWTLIFYLRQYAFPAFSVPIFELPQPISFSHPAYFLPVMALGALAYFLFRLHRSRWIVFAFLFFFCSIFFLLRYDSSHDTNIVADRFMYLPGLGFALLAGVVADWIRQKNAARTTRIVVGAFAALLIFYSIQTYRFTKIWKNSTTLWQHELRFYPNSHTAYNSLANALSDLPEYKRAKEDYRKIIRLKAQGVPLEIPSELRMSVQRVEELQGLYEKSIAAKPDFFRAHFNLGKFFEEVGMTKQAFESYIKTVEINPEFKDAHFNLASLYRDVGDSRNAVKAYQQSIRLNPRDPDHYISVIFAYNEAVRRFPSDEVFKAGRAEAFQQYVDFLNSRPSRPTSLFNLGVLLADAGETERAVSTYMMVLKQFPGHVNSLYNLGKIYLSSGQFQEALAMFERVTKIDHDHSDAWLNIGVIYNRWGKTQEAEQYYLRALKANARNGRALFNLAYIYEVSGDLGKAVEYYQQSVAADPANPESYYNFGNVLVGLNKLKEAVPLYQKAILLNPNHVNAWVNLSSISYRLGNYKLAVRALDEAILLGYVPEKEYLQALQIYR